MHRRRIVATGKGRRKAWVRGEVKGSWRRERRMGLDRTVGPWSSQCKASRCGGHMWHGNSYNYNGWLMV